MTYILIRQSSVFRAQGRANLFNPREGKSSSSKELLNIREFYNTLVSREMLLLDFDTLLSIKCISQNPIFPRRKLGIRGNYGIKVFSRYFMNQVPLRQVIIMVWSILVSELQQSCTNLSRQDRTHHISFVKMRNDYKTIKES